MRRLALVLALLVSGAFAIACGGGAATCTHLCGNPDRINGVDPCKAVTAQNIVDATTAATAVALKVTSLGPNAFAFSDSVHRQCAYRLDATMGGVKGSRTLTLDSWIDTPTGLNGKKYQALKASYPPGSSVVPNVEVYHAIGDEAFVVGEADVFVVTAAGVVIKIEPSPIAPGTIPAVRRDALTTLAQEAVGYIQH